jgi:tetratricopeptide (TPR) repeat protein
MLSRWPPLWIVLFFSWISACPARQQADEATIQRYSQQAEQALAAKDWNAAGPALEKLARLTPNVPEVYANLGTVYYTQGRYAQAAEALERALKLNPELPNVPLILAICYAQLGRAREAVPILEPAFRHPPNHEIARTIGLALMSVYTSLNEPLKALEISEELVARYPNDPEMLYRASHLYGDRALQTMMRLVQIAPESPWKRMAFAEALEAEKHYDLAIIEYRKVIEADPGMPGVHYRLGRALMLKAPESEPARDDAVKEFRQAITLDPRNAGAEYEMGEIFRRRGQPERAVDHFSRAVEIDPHFEDAQIGLGRTLIDLEKAEAALPHLRAAIQLNPTNEVSHFLLAGAYKSLGDAADYKNETALFQKYHVRPYADNSAGGGQRGQAPNAVTAPEATKQTLDSEGSKRPQLP